MRIDVEAWAPEYGAPMQGETLDRTDAEVDVGVELPAAQWRPIDAGRAPVSRVAFVDGVRRIDARVWVTPDGGPTRMGICASYAAGLVFCDGPSARILKAEVRRGLFTTGGVPNLPSRAGTYHAVAVAGDTIEQLSQSLQERMTLLEAEVARGHEGADMLVLDGPLTGKLDLTGAIGYVKTHRVAYLPGGLDAVIARLDAGQRSPLFLTQGSWSRFSWYLRLTPVAGHPWSGVVRCEVSAAMSLDEVKRTADAAAATIPRFASEPHKDPRAPQNLYPIAGLERELRRRTGDPMWVYRALLSAAAAPAPPG
jgi:hypothetical protein